MNIQFYLRRKAKVLRFHLCPFVCLPVCRSVSLSIGNITEEWMGESAPVINTTQKIGERVFM